MSVAAAGALERPVEEVPKQLFIAGGWRDAAGGATLAVEDPATEATLCEVADAGPDEAIAAANDTEYGLVAYVYTRDLGRALGVCERLDTGMIGLNQGLVSNAGAPFGGGKHSGLGREGGNEGIDEFLETKYVAISHG